MSAPRQCAQCGEFVHGFHSYKKGWKCDECSSAKAWTFVAWIGQPEGEPVRWESGRIFTSRTACAESMQYGCGEFFSADWSQDTEQQPGTWLDDVTLEPVPDVAAFESWPCPCCDAPAGEPCTDDDKDEN